MAYTFTQTGAEIQALLNFVQSKMETVLFSGDSQGDVTLSESAANFSELVIYYEGYNGRDPQSLVLAEPNGKTIDLNIVETNLDASVRIRVARYTISGTSMTLATGDNVNGYMLLKTTGNTWTDGNVIHITKVVGRG